MASSLVAISLAVLALGALAGVSMAVYVFASGLFTKRAPKAGR